MKRASRSRKRCINRSSGVEVMATGRRRLVITRFGPFWAKSSNRGVRTRVLIIFVIASVSSFSLHFTPGGIKSKIPLNLNISAKVPNSRAIVTAWAWVPIVVITHERHGYQQSRRFG
ncbi:hypothetical protein PIB30_033194 [Stylosanthes scabra]|uniref:Uncharacterized protein n=1 Tax=Stylosanthes scabra TaxID=79078 RepID=A0ABU6RCW8_9FABA|nr:hypothetical protein [Stylosanthes scabra]